MCCRYYIGETVDMEMIVAEMMKSPLVPEWQKERAVVTEGEVRPTDIVPVIAPDRSGKIKLVEKGAKAPKQTAVACRKKGK